MKQSFKSMFYTFIPIIIIFGWMGAHLAYEPILPGQEFTTSVVFGDNANGVIELSVPNGITIDGAAKKEVKDSVVKWVLSGKKGEYLLEYMFDDEKYSKEVLITKENEYREPIKGVKGSIIKSIEIGNVPRKLLNLGFWKPGWLGTYIIFSILFSLIIRKVIKVY